MIRYTAESSAAAAAFIAFLIVFFIAGLPPLHAGHEPGQQLAKAGELFEAGRYNDALEIYKKAADKAPARTEPYRGIIQCYSALGDTAGAAVFMESRYLDNPGNAAVCYGLGYSLYMRKKYKNALTFFQKAIELDPDMAEAWNNCAAIYHFIIRDYGKAGHHYRKAIELSKKSGNGRVLDIAKKNLANIPSPEELRPLEKELSLEEFINELIAAAEQSSDRRLGLLVRSRKKNAEDAFVWLLKQARGCAAGGRSAEEQKALTLCSLLEQHYRKAFRSDRLLSELEDYKRLPGQQKQRIAKAEALIEKAGKLQQKGDTDAAAAAYREAREIFKSAAGREQEGDVLLYLGDLYRRRGIYGKARTAYSDALTCFIEARREEKKAHALCSLGMSAYHLGDKEDAVDFLNRSLELYTQIEDRACAEKVQKNLEIIKNR